MNGTPHNRIVVGFDGSAAASAAIQWAEASARRLDAALEVVLAYESTSSWLLPDARRRVEEEMAERAGRLLDGIIARSAVDVAVDAQLVQGPAPSVLVERAEGARLLVVGAHGRGGVTPGVGSTAARCAVWSTVPTVVVPDQGPEPRLGPVVVAVDGSSASLQALEIATELADRDRALRLVHAWSSFIGSSFETPMVDPSLFEEAGQAILDRCLEQLDPADRARATTALLPGDPRVVLTNEASDASLVVLGTRGHSLMLHKLLGSTVTYLLHHQPAPIMVVPAERPS